MKEETKGYFICDGNGEGLWLDEKGDLYYNAQKTSVFTIRRAATDAMNCAIERLPTRERLDQNVERTLRNSRVKRLVTRFES